MIAALLLLFAGAVGAQVLRFDEGAAGTHLALKRLGTNISVLHITAHPDDEDAALLTYLSRGRGFRTALLSLNRGEGGANLAGPELYDALGVLRTEEFLAATRYYGVELFFTRTVDFGFSRRMDETLEHWSKETVLRDVVRFVRRYRPDIIVARFHGKARDGHGNHQTAGLMAQEAWRAAADPKQFPDAGPAWEVKKLYLSARASEPWTLKIDTGQYDALLGATYREIGSWGYRQHRTQGMAAVPAPRGQSWSYLQLIENRAGERGSEEDIAAGLTATSGFEVKEFDPLQPWTIASQLVGISRTKPQQATDAMNRALGLEFEAAVDPSGPVSPFQVAETLAAAVPGQRFSVTARVHQHSPASIEPVSLRMTAPSGWSVRETRRDRMEAQFEVIVPENATGTRPYWSRESEYRDHLYRIDRAEFEFLPFAPPELQAEFTYRVEGAEFVLRESVRTQSIDRLRGPQQRQLTVVPAVSLTVSPRFGILMPGRQDTIIEVELRSNAAVQGSVQLELPPGWIADPSRAPFEFQQAGEIRQQSFKVSRPAKTDAGGAVQVRAIAEAGGRKYSEGYIVAGYPGLEPHHVYRPAIARLQNVDVRVAPGARVGYIAGAGDEIPAALAQLGVPVTALTPEDLASRDFSQFTAIVVGVRASAVRPDWKAHRERLLEYVQNGGHLIVQYQTAEFDEAPYGPFPYKLTSRADEVSEEAATVTMLAPGHSLFESPNRITSSDWDGWVEERGSKFMTEWDGRYTAIVESHDRDQPPLRGGLLQAQFGKGLWTYAALAFYRQLPAGVPGAYRLFANLISQRAQP